MDKIIHLKHKKQLVLVTAEQNIRTYAYAGASFTNVDNIVGFNDEITDLKFSPSFKHMIIMATNSSVLKVYDKSTKKYIFLNL